MDWIGITGLDPSWVPPACYKEFALNDPEKRGRTLIIQPPNICLTATLTPEQYEEAVLNPDTEEKRKAIELYEAELELLKWLRTTCITKLVIHTTDGSLLRTREAGWSPDEQVLTIQTASNIVNTQWYFVIEATKFWYPKRWDCGLLRVGEYWYRVPKYLRRSPNESVKETKTKYETLDLIEREALTFDLSLATEEEVKRCTEQLLHYFLKRIYEELWKTDTIIPFYALFMDEPWEQASGEDTINDNPQFRGMLRGLYDAIRRGRENEDPFFSGDGYGTYFGVGAYDAIKLRWSFDWGIDVADVGGYADYIFDTKYDADFYVGGDFPWIHLGSDDQSQDWYYWRDYEPDIAKKMRGAWLHLLDDVDEIQTLVSAALELGWKDLYVFPAPDETYWDINYPNDWRNACKYFRESVKDFCEEIAKNGLDRGQDSKVWILVLQALS